MDASSFQTKLFTNKVIDKGQLKGLMSDLFNKYGTSKCTYVADKLKILGFRYATQAGLSLNIEDLRVPDTKKLNLASSESFIQEVEESFVRADITSVDRFQYVIDKWSSVSDKIKDEVVKYFVESDPFNPIYMMAFSGARGNLSQVRQLIGMRGLMSDPQGQLIGLPIKSNFREGLTVTEYIISSYGARKGIVDTALRTADSGYLTRRLVDVSQDIIVKAKDCGTNQGILVTKGSNISLEGRTLLKDIFDSQGNRILEKNKQIDKKSIELLAHHKVISVEIRSSITCELNHSVCQLCYGWNLATRKLIDLGEAVGILAAQSIGEPGTQLTMRTFHTGGTFMGTLSDAVYSFDKGYIQVIGSKSIFKPHRFSEGEWNIKTKKQAKLQLKKIDGRICSLKIPKNSSLPIVKNGSLIEANQIISKPPIQESAGSEQVTKRISSDKQGLVLLDNLSLNAKEDKNGNVTQVAQSQGFVWVCLSDVLTIPTNTLLLVKKGDTLKKNKCIVKSTISNSFGGLYNKSFNNQEYANNILLASYFSNNCNLEKVENSFVFSHDKFSSNYKLSLTKKSFNNSIQVIGESVPDLGFYSQSGRVKIETGVTENSSRKGGDSITTRVHLIPEYYFNSVEASKEIYVKAGDFVEQGCELFSGTFAEKAGIVDILETDEDTFDLVLRPGILIDSPSKSLNLNKLNKRVIPNYAELNLNLEGGEHCKFVYIEQLTFDDEEQSFLISPVETYTIPIEQEVPFNNNYKSSEFKKPFKIFEKINCLVEDGDIIKNLNETIIILNQLVFEFKLTRGLFNAQVRFESIKSGFGLRIDIYEKLNSTWDFGDSKYIRNQKLVHDGQYIYASSKFFENQLLTSESSLVNSVERISSNRKLVCLAKKSDHQIYKLPKSLESLALERGFVRRGNKVKENVFAKSAGRVVCSSSEKLRDSKDKLVVMQRAQPYLIAKNSFLKTKDGYLVRKNDLIAFLTYEVAKTEDIIQGLPRVEELLEARPPKNKCILSTIPGFISVVENCANQSTANILETSTIVVQNTNNLREKYTVPKLRKIVKTGDFVGLGERLTDGQIDLRELLQITFDFNHNVLQLNNYLAAVKSFRHLQSLLIKEIQNVYKSQGVDISDKHIEIIVRQMTTKVKVEDSGKTTLVPGELIDLEKIRRINAIAQYHGYISATYTPVLLGITKASLNTDSFISAASFQETARVLTKAAVEGKKDWLKGLKENVIVGRLIPAGTGFKQNNKYPNQVSKGFDLYTNSEIGDMILDKRAGNRE